MADNEIPVIMRFLAETSDLQEGTEEVEDATEDAIDHLQSLAETAGQIAQDAVDQVSASYQTLKREVQTIAAAVAAIGVTTSAGIVAIGKSAVGAAQNFEDLRARLRGLTGDAERANEVFAEAVEFAARTPFSVESIVAATAQLEAFGVGGAENLELVANIAASTQGRLEDVSLRVAKALSGSSEGFQALRDTAGVTGAKLAQFGANLSSTSLVALKTEKDIRLATTALKELGKTEFAGAIDRQADTLTGAISNAKDATTNFLAVIGEAAVPTVTALARSFANGVNAATEFIRPFSPLITLMGAFTAAAAGAVGAVAGFAIPFAGIIAKGILVSKAFGLARTAVAGLATSSALLPLVEARVAALTATMGTSTAGFSLFNAAGTFFSTAVAPRVAAGFTLIQGAAARAAAFMAPFAPLLLAGAAAGAIGAIAIRSYVAEQERLSATLTKQAKNLTSATNQFREYTRLLNEATGVEFDFGNDVGETVRDFAAAMKEVSAVDLAAAVERSGKSLQDLNTDLANNRKQADSTRAQLIALQQAANDSSGGFVEVYRQSDEVRKVLKETFGDRGRIEIEEVNARLKELNLEFSKLGQGAVLIRGMIDVLGEIPTNLDLASTKAEALNNFLSFAGRLTDVNQLNQALALTNNELADIEANLLASLGTLDRFKLTAKLGDPKLDEERETAIKRYLGLLDARASLEDKIAGENEKSRQEEIKAFELVTERRKVLDDLTLKQERARVEQQLRFVEQGSAEELAILRRLAGLDEQIRRDRVQKVKELVDEEVSAVQDRLSEVRSRPNSTNSDLVNELRDSIGQLEAFEAANRKAFKGAPEEAERFRDRLVALKRELRGAEASQLVDQFQALKGVLSTGIDANGTTGQQIARTAAAIDVLKKAIRSGAVDQGQAEQFIVELEQRKLDLNRKQTDEKLKQANEIAQLEIRALDDEIRILELRKSAGEQVDRKLEESREKRLQLSLEAIEKEKEAAIKAGADVTLAEKRASLDRQKALRDEATRQFQAAQPPTATGQISGATERARPGFGGRGSGLGFSQPQSNSFSPQSGLNTGFSGIQATNLPNFFDNFGASRFKSQRPEAPRFVEIERRIEAQQARIRDGSASKLTDSQKKVIQNNSFVVNGVDGDMAKQKMVEASQEMVRRNRRSDLTSGSSTSNPIAVGRPRR